MREVPGVGNDAKFPLLGTVPHHRARKSSALTQPPDKQLSHRSHPLPLPQPLPPPYLPAPTAPTFRLIQEKERIWRGVTGIVNTPLLDWVAEGFSKTPRWVQPDKHGARMGIMITVVAALVAKIANATVVATPQAWPVCAASIGWEQMLRSGAGDGSPRDMIGRVADGPRNTQFSAGQVGKTQWYKYAPSGTWRQQFDGGDPREGAVFGPRSVDDRRDRP